MSGEVFRLFNEGVTASLAAHQHRERGDHAGAGTLENQALAAFDQALRLEPTHIGALSGKGMCLAQLGRTSEAAKWFRRATEVDPESSENHRQLGLCYAELGNLEAARAATQRAVELDGQTDYRRQAANELYNFGQYVVGLASAHRDGGEKIEEEQRYRHARGLFCLALEIDQDNAAARHALGVVERRLEEC